MDAGLLDAVGIAARPAPKVVLQREQRYRFALLGADVLAGLTALEVALSLVGTASPQRAALLALPLIVLLAKLHGLYDRDDLLVRKTTIEEVPRLFQHATLATLVLVLVDEPLKIGATTDTQAGLLLVLLLILTVLFRMGARRIAGAISQPERCLVLGDTASAEELFARTEGRSNIAIVGAAGLRDLRTYADLCQVIDEFEAERLIIVQGSEVPQQQTLELVRAAKVAGVRVSLLPGVLGVVGSQVEFDDVFGVTLLGVRRFGLTRSSRALKRIFDIACALPLLILASPVVLAAAIAIRRDGGSVFFRQERVGRDGRRFHIIKLRTMVVDAEHLRSALSAQNVAGEGLFKIIDDPRITKVGAILRRTHLDELPQLWNVVRGEMSLVGPRPLVAHEDAHITGLDRRRLELTPGMTGPWQILGSHRRIPMAEMVKIDYLYAASWSLWNDVKILLRTLSAVARRAGV
ncbi:exopolysaccharide biosynthesis polyprenyl glycosylphosphotransferase [Paraconexibacter antarcticus]|uniref:Exopolysaccharide biosynthesis polyprenyl glycosylphosphotransferase n=1 Tax=Paraconexibacter antarcticus TaxID=2949664 RepID=A0ABY5DWI6_9ACTN|nr:exopolysaccharide biosynthesis polyprenyl glycosylphosphotransferase [Paraconexibacter antarcticus]UTI65037.1 exopolysaccharide biosynthesis polyprenyl glycosylphosphotransferase [Paraconexibacter antarcticus]